MPESIPENKLPLNQLAKQALKLLKLPPDPTDLYLLELMRWCVDHKKVNLPGPHTAQSTLREFLDAFYTWDPKNIMQVFQEDSDGYPIQAYPPGTLGPVRFAQALIDQLDSRLTAALLDYPTAFKVED